VGERGIGTRLSGAECELRESMGGEWGRRADRRGSGGRRDLRRERRARRRRVRADEPVRNRVCERDDIMPALTRQADEVQPFVEADDPPVMRPALEPCRHLPFGRARDQGRQNYFGYLYLSCPGDSSRAMVK